MKFRKWLHSVQVQWVLPLILERVGATWVLFIIARCTSSEISNFCQTSMLVCFLFAISIFTSTRTTQTPKRIYDGKNGRCWWLKGKHLFYLIQLLHSSFKTDYVITLRDWCLDGRVHTKFFKVGIYTQSVIDSEMHTSEQYSAPSPYLVLIITAFTSFLKFVLWRFDLDLIYEVSNQN